MYPKWKSIPMEIDSQSPTRDNTPAIKSVLKSAKKQKKWKCDDITPVSLVNEEIRVLNPNFDPFKRDM